MFSEKHFFKEYKSCMVLSNETEHAREYSYADVVTYIICNVHRFEVLSITASVICHLDCTVKNKKIMPDESEIIVLKVLSDNI